MGGIDDVMVSETSRWLVDPLHPVSIGKKLALARQLRREPAPTERYAWKLLRNRRILGLKFRRQHVLCGFIVDFYCARLKLVIELDGGYHDETSHASYDAARNATLRAAGFRVIRIRNKHLNKNHLLELLLPLVPPLPEGEGARG